MVFEFIRGQQSTRLLLLGGGRFRAALGRFGRAAPTRRRVDDGRRWCLLFRRSPRRGRTGVVVVRSRAAAELGVELFGGERARDSSAAVGLTMANRGFDTFSNSRVLLRHRAPSKKYIS